MSARYLPLLLLAACIGGGDDTAADDSSGGDDTAQAACASLDETSCEARSDCVSIRGASEDEVCAGDYTNWMTIWAGCMDGDLGCGDAETCGEASDGTHLIFPDTCIPGDWSGCDYCP